MGPESGSTATHPNPRKGGEEKETAKEEKEVDEVEEDKKNNVQISHEKNSLFHSVYNFVSFDHIRIYSLCLLIFFFATRFSVIQCETKKYWLLCGLPTVRS
jgi:hypothetical protein